MSSLLPANIDQQDREVNHHGSKVSAKTMDHKSLNCDVAVSERKLINVSSMPPVDVSTVHRSSSSSRVRPSDLISRCLSGDFASTGMNLV